MSQQVRSARLANWQANECARMGYGGAAHEWRILRNRCMSAARAIRALGGVR